jgi:hypothetical protein
VAAVQLVGRASVAPLPITLCWALTQLLAARVQSGRIQMLRNRTAQP